MSTAIAESVSCPVCNMPVKTAGSKLRYELGEKTYHFCNVHCRQQFLERVGMKPRPAPRGWFGRFLERLGNSNQKEFGCCGPKCH